MDGSELDVRRVRAAQNQSLFRDSNERTNAREWAVDSLQASFVCECLDLNCTQRILLSREEYEGLRESPTRFAVLHGHELQDVEVVVDKTARYVVVQKLGVAADVAEQLDPRREFQGLTADGNRFSG
jgi:hypothetical protein